jgi:hypothetical protein
MDSFFTACFIFVVLYARSLLSSPKQMGDQMMLEIVTSVLKITKISNHHSVPLIFLKAESSIPKQCWRIYRTATGKIKIHMIKVWDVEYCPSLAI